MNGKLTLVWIQNRNEAFDWNNDDKVHLCVFATPDHIVSMTYFVWSIHIHRHHYSAITISISPFQQNYKSQYPLRYISLYRPHVGWWLEHARSRKITVSIAEQDWD